MTSETLEKEPLIIAPFGLSGGGPRAYRNTFGVLVILSTWVYLYFACIGTLYDGIKEFLMSSDHHVHVLSSVATELAVTVASQVLVGGNAPVEFGTGKYYAVCFCGTRVDYNFAHALQLCGFGGVLSCGLTHTAIVPLDLVKCRIQVCERKLRLQLEMARALFR